MTTEDFIAKAKQIHGDTYDYSKVNYTKSTAKVEIVCPKHGSFFQITSNHIDPKIRCGYTMDEIESYIRQSYAEEEKKTSKEYQRQLLTPSLRYDIMKRDRFRCVLCGRTSKDGIALHVDHILPVSKGGQTIPSNLRTLCDVCNLGKSDKYDNDGLN